MNNNRYLAEFLKIYSQSLLSTELTRGLDEKTYIQTKLDTELKNDILSGQKKLVILTGNAGDGKTAFIQLIESSAKAQGAVFNSQTDNGCQFSFNGFEFETLYDGSQDFNNVSNEQLLKSFFKPFEGKKEPEINIVKIIAINEGKLRDFILGKSEYTWLGKHVHHYLEYENHTLPKSLAFINLNNRAVVELDNENSIFDKLLNVFLDKEHKNNFWKDCRVENCKYANKCYIKQNIDSFNDKVLGPIIRERLKELITIIYLKRVIHITMRDIRSLLSYILFNKYTCQQLQDDIDRQNNLIINRYYYQNSFDENEVDRMIKLFREIDITEVPLPKVENQIYFNNPKSENIQNLLVKRTLPNKTDLDYIEDFFKNKPQGTSDTDEVRKRKAEIFFKAIKRKLFFEGDDNQLKEEFGIDHYSFLPYKYFKTFVSFLKTGKDDDNKIRNDLVLAISKSEKIYNETIGRENICIRSNKKKKTRTKAFYSFKAADFEIVLPNIGDEKKYLEYFPDHIIFRHVDKKASLEINIDLFEILMRIKEGYIPTSIEIQTFFLNLEMFKRRLLAKRSTKIILTEDDTNLYSFEKSQNGKLVLTKI